MQSNNPNFSNEGSSTTFRFPNIIYAVKTIKQNYSEVSKISLDRSRVV